MPTKSGDVSDSNVPSVITTKTDETKVLNTRATKPNIIANEVEENTKNDLKSSPSIARKKSLTNSWDSNNITIETLDENGDESSAIVSDSDCEDVLSPHEMQASGTNGIVMVNGNSTEPSVIHSHEQDASKLNIGSIAVQNSRDVTIGNKTYILGPMNVTQFIHDNNEWKATEQGNDNPAFVNVNTSGLYRQRNNNEMGNVPNR